MKHVKTYIIGGLIGSMCLAYTSCDSKLDQVNPNELQKTSGRMRLILSWHLLHAIHLFKNALNGGYYGTRGVMMLVLLELMKWISEMILSEVSVPRLRILPIPQVIPWGAGYVLSVL